MVQSRTPPKDYESKPGFANIAQIIHETHAEGPGCRTAIWFQGCSILCKECCNPSFLAFKDNNWMSHIEIMDSVKDKKIEGITFLGGEPFDQPISLHMLTAYTKQLGLSVMIFTGYYLDYLKSKNDPFINQILNNADILVDGMYEESLRTNRIRWVGSTNQTMHFLTDRYSKDEPQFSDSNTVEYRYQNGELIVNGWPINGKKSPLISADDLIKKK